MKAFFELKHAEDTGCTDDRWDLVAVEDPFDDIDVDEFMGLTLCVYDAIVFFGLREDDEEFTLEISREDPCHERWTRVLCDQCLLSDDRGVNAVELTGWQADALHALFPDGHGWLMVPDDE